MTTMVRPPQPADPDSPFHPPDGWVNLIKSRLVAVRAVLLKFSLLSLRVSFLVVVRGSSSPQPSITDPPLIPDHTRRV